MKEKEFGRLVESIRQAGRIRRGENTPARAFDFAPADIRQIRHRLGKSQVEFALLIGVSLGTLRNWEQGRRRPEGPARALLMVASRDPEAVEIALCAELRGKYELPRRKVGGVADKKPGGGVQQVPAEDTCDLAAFVERACEPDVPFDAALRALRKRGKR